MDLFVISDRQSVVFFVLLIVFSINPTWWGISNSYRKKQKTMIFCFLFIYLFSWFFLSSYIVVLHCSFSFCLFDINKTWVGSSKMMMCFLIGYLFKAKGGRVESNLCKEEVLCLINKGVSYFNLAYNQIEKILNHNQQNVQMQGTVLHFHRIK